MSLNCFAPLDPPPKQPRRSKFLPKNGRHGRAKIDLNLRNAPTTVKNVDKLNEFGVTSLTDSNVSVKAGDVLIAAQPFVHVLSTSCRGSRCEGCFKRFDKNSAIICDCKFAYFCNDECRKSDTLHVEECRLLKKSGKGPTSDIARYLLRAILKIRSGGLSEGDVVPGSSEPRKFFHLVDHFDDILERSDHRTDLIEHIYTEVLDFMGEEDAPDPDYFLSIYGRIAVNSFSIVDGPEQDSIGSGLYLGPSIFDHSCMPNAAASFMPDRTIVIRALDDFPERNFGQFFITYIDLMDHVEHRRNHLFRNYYFLCQCARCSDQDSEKDMFTMTCKNCNRPEIFLGGIEAVPETLKCSNCEEICSNDDRESYIYICDIVRDKLNDVTIPLDVANFCLNQMKKSNFGPYHIFVVQSTMAAFEGAIYMFEKTGFISRNNLDLLKRAHEYGLFLLDAYEKYRRSRYWSCQGLVLAKMSQIEKKLAMGVEAETHLKAADEILTIAHGGNVLKEFDTLTLNGDI
jgi:SET and MYND domain-containing protein